MPRQVARAARLFLLFTVAVAMSAAAKPAERCEAGPLLRARCGCGGVASIGRAMDSAALVAIAVFDSTVDTAAVANAPTWPLRIERAWKWPGGGTAPPRHIVVAQGAHVPACAITIMPGQRQLVVAFVRPADGALVLGHKCGAPWGAVDTLGPTAADVRRFAGDAAVRNIARYQARMLDSLRIYGPGIEP